MSQHRSLAGTWQFQLDPQGKVTGAVLEQQGPQGAQRMPLERK